MAVDVAVIGSANVDLVVEVERRPGAGETLFGGDLQQLPGGKGANQAAAAARSGAQVAMIACVGPDSNGAFLRESLERAGVDTTHVSEGSRPTGTAIILVTPDGENSIVVSSGANFDVDRALVERTADVWTSTRVLVMNHEIPFDVVTAAAERAEAAGVRLVLNAAPSRFLEASMLARCDPLIVNEHEAREVLGVDDDDPDANRYERLAERLRDRGARSVVITLGGDGAIVVDSAGKTHVAAHRVPVVDTTGAGDAFVGAVACELASGASLGSAVEFATAVSAVSVQRVGAQASYADRPEVEAFIAASRGGRG